MSALIRYFLSKGKLVAGYDKTPSDLTKQLNEEGALIHYDDNVDLISIGAYKSGTNPVLDDAIAHNDKINNFLKQRV